VIKHAGSTRAPSNATLNERKTRNDLLPTTARPQNTANTLILLSPKWDSQVALARRILEIAYLLGLDLHRTFTSFRQLPTRPTSRVEI